MPLVDKRCACWQVLEALADVAEQVMGRAVGADEPLMAAGLDSLGAVELKNATAIRFGVALPATLVFDFPTLRVGTLWSPAVGCCQAGSECALSL